MTQPPSVIPRGEVIKQVRGECELTQEALADLADIHVRTLRKAEKGKESTIKTMMAIYAALRTIKPNLKYEDLTFGTGGLLPVVPAPTLAEMSLTLYNFTIRVSAPADKIDGITTQKLKAVWKVLFADYAHISIDECVPGNSIVIHAHSERIGAEALLDAFISWRLQYIGVYEVTVTTNGANSSLTDSIAPHFAFINSGMRDRFKSSLRSEHQVTVATDVGLHVMRQSTTKDDRSAIRLTRQCASAAADVIQSFADKDSASLESIIIPISDQLRAIAQSKGSNHVLKDQLLSQLLHIEGNVSWGNSSHGLTFDDFLNSVHSVVYSRAAAWHSITLHSTLLGKHLHSSERYWEDMKMEVIPRRAHFQSEDMQPQRAILMDDETFLSLPVHQSL